MRGNAWGPSDGRMAFPEERRPVASCLALGYPVIDDNPWRYLYQAANGMRPRRRREAVIERKSRWGCLLSLALTLAGCSSQPRAPETSPGETGSAREPEAGVIGEVSLPEKRHQAPVLEGPAPVRRAGGDEGDPAPEDRAVICLEVDGERNLCSEPGER